MLSIFGCFHITWTRVSSFSCRNFSIPAPAPALKMSPISVSPPCTPSAATSVDEANVWARNAFFSGDSACSRATR